jgi:hypothetical protein
MKNTLDELCGFSARQPKPIMNDVRQVGAGQGPAESSLLAHPSDAEVGHFYASPAERRVPQRSTLHLRNGN